MAARRRHNGRAYTRALKTADARTLPVKIATA